MGQERLLGESGSRVWLREWGKRERVWGESGMRARCKTEGARGRVRMGFK